MTLSSRTNVLGALAVLIYVPHAIWHIADHSVWDLLWVCNVAIALLATGCFLRSARLCVTALLFLVYGTPLWVVDTVIGGPLVPTSPLIHLGGIAVGVLAVRTLGWPPRTWAVSAAAVLATLALTYVASPRAANVNLVFRIQDGWEGLFRNHATYLAGLWLSATAEFFVIERVVRRPKRTARR